MTTNENNTRDATADKVSGVLARYDGAESLKAAARSFRDAGYTKWDCFSPFPVHGIDPAMGIRRTRLPLLVFAAGLAGGIVALLMQWWTNAVDYPIIISGKPLFSIPANIPVTFELIVLFAAFATFFGVLAMNNLPKYQNPFESSEQLGDSTRDGFFLGVEANDPKFDEARVNDLMTSTGATSVEACIAPPPAPPLPSAVVWGAATLCILAVLPPLVVAKMRVSLKEDRYVHPVLDMDYQASLGTQDRTTLFEDGRTMRPRLAETVAQYDAPRDLGIDEQLAESDVFHEHFAFGAVDGQHATSYPLPVTDELMARGRERYGVFCATCHGLSGDGDGPTTVRALERGVGGWNKPPALYDEYVVNQTAGKLFNTITNGVMRSEVQAMPGYASQIPPQDRWAIILYLRALQRSQNASIDDIPEDKLRQLK
jgi:mono/diheme cytochrome c family protein